VTYALLTLPFLAVAAAVTAWSGIRPGLPSRLAASAVAAAALLVLTAVFDNLMIAAGLFSYPREHLLGVFVGAAPIEDLAYPLSAAFLVPAVFALLRRRA
jgi:lycopene cyclase domain-containing protein